MVEPSGFMACKKNLNKMKSNKRTKTIALFMIYLFAMLPFASIGFAQTSYTGLIKEIFVHGEDNVHRTAKVEENFIIFEVDIRETGVNPDNVLLNRAVAFDGCENDGSNSRCTLRLPQQFQEGTQYFEIKYKTETKTISFVLDSTIPIIENFGMNRLEGGEIRAVFNARDRALNSNFCAGVAIIEISDDEDFDNVVATRSYETDIENCLLNDEIIFQGPIETGEFNYFIRATDALGFSSDGKRGNLGLDIDAPIILDVGVYSGGSEVTRFGPGTRTYELRAIVEEHRGIQRVSADLSEFGLSSDATAQCTNVGAIYTCKWNINPTISDDTTELSGTVLALDVDNNLQTSQFTIPVEIDNDNPAISNIETVSGNFGKNPEILSAKIVDEGGININRVFAELSQLGLSSEKTPTKCEDDICYWENLVPTRLSGDADIIIYAEDIYGHSSSATETFTIDTINPTFLNYTYSPREPSYPDVITLTVNAYDNETGLDRIKVEAGDISTRNESFVSECGTNKCVVSINQLNPEAVKDKLMFKIYDEAGNFVSGETQDIQIYKTNDTYVPDFVGIKIGSVTPNRINRKIAKQVPIKVFVPISYNLAEGVEISEKISRCGGDLSIYLKPSSSNNPYWIGDELLVFDFLFNPATAQVDFVEFNCTLSFLTRKDYTIYTTPEVENLHGRIELYDKSTIDENVEKKLKKIEDNVDGFWEWIEKADKVVNTLKKICDGMEYINKVYSAIESLKGVVLVAARALALVAEPAGEAVWKGFLKVESFVRVLKEWLWPNDYEFQGISSNGINFMDLVGGVAKEQAKGAVFNGWARRACAFVKCEQCNQGFQLTNFLSADDNPFTSVEGDTWNFATNPFDSLTNFGGPSFDSRLSDDEYERLVRSSRRESEQYDAGLFSDINIESQFNPEDSIFVAVNCMCMTGVIHNLKKLRQLDCMQAKCIKDMASSGFSTAECDIQHSVRKCEYWTGAILEILPGFAWVNQIFAIVENWILTFPARIGQMLFAWLQGASGISCEAWKRGVSGTIEDALKIKTPVSTFKQVIASDLGDISVFSPTADLGVVCGLIDAGMLTISFREFFEDAFSFPDRTDEIDYCEGVFED